MATIRNLMLRLGMEVDTDGAQRGLGRLESLVDKSSGAIGIAGGVALGAALVGAIDLSASRGKLQAQLGLTADESRRVGDVAGKLFSNAYGESMEEVNTAITSVIRNIDGMRNASSSSLEQTTARAITLSKVMDEDVGKTTEAVSQLMRTGLAKNSQQAFDVLTRGAQLGVDKSHDLLDTFVEYPTQFRKLGLSAEQSMGLLNQGLLAGARNSDVVADALKEFSIRAVDGSKLTADGFKMIGLSGQDMAEKVSRGGKSATDALSQTLKQIKAIPDPVLRSQAAVALFGTQAEDLGDALLALDPTTAVRSLGQVAGAADQAGKALGDTAASRMEAFKRSVEHNVVAVVDTVIQSFNKLPQTVQNGLVQFATVATFVTPLIIALVKAKQALVAFAATSIGSSLVSRLGGMFDTLRLKAMYAVEGFSRAEGPVNKFKTALGGITGVASRARSALSGAVSMLGGPWGLAITGAIAAITWFATRNDEAEQRVKELTDTLDKQTGSITSNTREWVVSRLESEGLLKVAEKLGINLQTVTDAALGNKDALASVNRTMDAYQKQLVDSGAAQAAMYAGADELDIGIGNLRSTLSDSNSELRTAVESQKRVASAMGKTDSAIDPVVAGNNNIARSADNAANKTDRLTAKLSAFNNKAADADLAAIEFKESIDRLSSSITKNNNGISKRTGLFDLNTRKGRDNTKMVIDAIRAAADHSQKLRDEGKSVDVVNKSFSREIGQLRGVLEKMGLSRKSIDSLIRKYADMASKINKSTSSIKDRKVKIHVNADGTVNLPGGTKASVFASGGILPGYTPGRDVHYFHSPNGQTIGLSGGEAVMRPEFTRGVGAQWVNEMNYIARTGGPTAVKNALGPFGTNGPGNKRLGGEGMFFAGGGIIHESKLTGLSQVQKMVKAYDAKLGAWTWSTANKIVKKLNELGVGGPKVQKALKWAKSKAGKPYVWGGVGPGGWDCSGFMGSIWAIIKGKNPYARYFSTHSFGSKSGPGGFVRNAQSGFKVGVTNAGVGHMAGTLGRTNVESSGSRGVRVGGGARGWNNGLFPYRYGLRMDNGGTIPPKSIVPVYNGTSKPEYAIPHRFMSESGGDTYNITINAGAGTNSRELEKAVFDAIKKYKHSNGRNISI